jgi:hypothetical protein
LPAERASVVSTSRERWGSARPLGHEQATGRNLTWNDTFEYNIFKKIWPETEVNFIHYYQDEHNGNTVVYFTPGLVLGRFHLWDYVSFTVGGAYEIAVT